MAAADGEAAVALAVAAAVAPSSTGLAPVNSHTRNRLSSCSPETRSASLMNCGMVPLPPAGVDEPGLDGEAGAEHQLLGDRDAVVAGHGGEAPAYLQAVPGRDRELVLGPRPAGRPLTLIERTVSPTKSRLNRERFWVARAEMVATPTSRSVAGS